MFPYPWSWRSTIHARWNISPWSTALAFGYDLARIDEVSVQVETTDESVRVVNTGPARKLDIVNRSLLGIGADFDFVDEWVTYFSPVFTVFQHWWRNRKTQAEARIRTLIFMFYIPVSSEHETDWMIFSYAKSRWPGPAGGLRLFGGLVMRQIRSETDRDIQLLTGLDNHNVHLSGSKLSRFDKAA